MSQNSLWEPWARRNLSSLQWLLLDTYRGRRGERRDQASFCLSCLRPWTCHCKHSTWALCMCRLWSWSHKSIPAFYSLTCSCCFDCCQACPSSLSWMRLLLFLMSIKEHNEQERTDFDLEPPALPLPGSTARRSYFASLWLVCSPTVKQKRQWLRRQSCRSGLSMPVPRAPCGPAETTRGLDLRTLRMNSLIRRVLQVETLWHMCAFVSNSCLIDFCELCMDYWYFLRILNLSSLGHIFKTFLLPNLLSIYFTIFPYYGKTPKLALHPNSNTQFHFQDLIWFIIITVL